MKSNDIILIASLLVVSVLLLVITSFSGDGERVVVNIDGEITYYPINIDTTVKLTGANGQGSNLLVISNGRASVESADCPDKICVEHHPISYQGETIVCLPHKLVVSVE